MHITVSEFKPNDFSVTLLKTLEAGGIVNPVLFGGAVRDQFLKIPDKIKDYDVWADFGSLLGEDIYLESDIPQHISDKILEVLPGAALKCIEGFDRGKETDFIAIKLILDYQGEEVSLFVNNRPQEAHEKIHGDAPINAVVMDAKGVVYAHPSFEDHVGQKIYEPFPYVSQDVAEARYTHLKAKIPELQHMGNQMVVSVDRLSASATLKTAF